MYTAHLVANELLERVDAELFSNALCCGHILLVLGLVLDLVLDALIDADSSGVVVDAAGCLQGRGDDVLVGHKVVGKAVVEATLELKEVVYAVEELGVWS